MHVYIAVSNPYLPRADAPVLINWCKKKLRRLSSISSSGFIEKHSLSLHCEGLKIVNAHIRQLSHGRFNQANDEYCDVYNFNALELGTITNN